MIAHTKFKDEKHLKSKNPNKDLNSFGINIYNLNNYFGLHVCLSFRWFICTLVTLKDFKSYHKMSLIKVLWYVLKYAFWITPRLLESMWQVKESQATYNTSLGEAKPSCIYQNSLQCFITSRRWSQAVLCISTPRMYQQSWYFLVSV